MVVYESLTDAAAGECMASIAKSYRCYQRKQYEESLVHLTLVFLYARAAFRHAALDNPTIREGCPDE